MNNNKTAGSLTEKDLKDRFIDRLSGKMAKADWYYEYSDDHNEWRKGTIEISGIKDDLKALSRLEGGLDESKKLWAQHVPPHSINEPTFFSNPKLLTCILDGMIMKHDAHVVQTLLQDQQKEGNRFVAFDSDPLTSPKDRFTGFPLAIEARNFAYEKSTLEENYVVHSIADIQKEIQHALHSDKGHAMKVIAEKLQQHQQEEKPSRSQEISR